MSGARQSTAREHLSSASETKQRVRARGAGEGMIRHLTNRDLWEARLMVGVRSDGKPDVRSRYGKTRAEALAKLDALRRDATDGRMADADKERLSIGAFLNLWLETAKPDLRETTWRRYADLIRLHIGPALGKVKLRSLRPDQLQQFYAKKRREGRANKPLVGLSPRTVRQMHAILHRALDQAVQWRYIGHNVADLVTAPKFPRFEVPPPTPDELVRLLDAAEEGQDRLRALWVAAVHTGCRQGELLGLKWAALDLDCGALSVRETLVRVDGTTPVLGEPKTEHSRRTIKLPKEAIAALRQHRERQAFERNAAATDYANYGLVFATELGTPLRARNVVRAFKAALRRAGLSETVRFHDLRHAHATVLRRAGIDIKSVSERLGHSSIVITADLYTHALDEADVEAAGRFEQALRQA